MPSRIMVIDDEPDVRLYLLTALEDAGHEGCAPNVDETVEEAIARLRPDLISLDILMPKRSGIAIYRMLRSSDRFRRIPVVIVSGMLLGKDVLDDGFRELVHDDRIPPPDGYVQKPVDLKILSQVVSELLRKEA
ncbi:MAG: response regulator [Deltaproteobacteria bacterium]|nr:response regulator [Deltaproteobacteria bacterium]